MLFKNVAEKNKDGFGFMYYDTTKQEIVWDKTSTGDWEEHYSMFLPHEAHEICLHWRYGTHGTKNIENAHPHVVKEGELMLMHNGVITGYGYNSHTAVDKASDTVEFLDKTLRPLYDGTIDLANLVPNKGFRHLLGAAVGANNKLMLLTKQGFTMINQFYITAETYIPEMRGLLFSNNYAWNNEYWYESAYRNEINAEYVTKEAPRYGNYSSGVNYNTTPYGSYGYHGTKTSPASKETEGEQDNTNAAQSAYEETSEGTPSSGGNGKSTPRTKKERLKCKVIALNGKYKKKSNNIQQPLLPQSIITPRQTKELPVLLNNVQALRDIVDGNTDPKKSSSAIDLVEIGKDSNGTPVMAAQGEMVPPIRLKEHTTVQ